MGFLTLVFRKLAAVTLGIGVAWIFGAPLICAPAPAQDRLWADRELVPPLRLVEEDFKKGFSKTFQFPRDCWPAISGRDRCEGTILLKYTPGYLAPIRAVINFRYVYYCYGCGEEGRDKGPYYFSVNLSGDLEPVDEDPEGKFPAVRYNQFLGDFRPIIRTNDPERNLVPNSEFALVDIVLLQDIDGTIDRTTYARFRFEIDTKSWDPDHKRWEFGPWFFEGMYGPPSSEDTEEEKSLTLEGCSDLLKGGKGQLTAKAKPGGGKYKWSTDSGSVLSVSGSGSSASVSAKSPGRSAVRVEYETKDGETIEAEKAGSVVELRSVAPVPQIPLIDENGKELPPVQVSVVQDPPDGDLLTFAVADPGVATVLNLGSVLQVQGIREGTTMAQAQTACGEKTGPVLNLEVVRCDEKTVQKLRDELRMMKSRLDSNLKQRTEITADDEFDRAAREGPDEIKDVAKSTAELISSTMGAAGKATKAAETADKLWGLFNTMNDMATGLAEGDMDKVGGATFDATVQVLDLTLVGLAKTAYAAGTASRKLARSLGTLCGAADRLKELEDQEKETVRELEDIERRLYKVCGQKSSPPKEPSTPAKPEPKPEPTPGPKPTPSKTEPPKGQEPPEPKGDKPQTEPGGEKPQPPVPPPSKPSGGTAGLPLNCGCDSSKQSAGGSQDDNLANLSNDLRRTSLCAEVFQSSLLPGFENDLDLLRRALRDVSGARSLPKQEMQARFGEFLTRTDGLSTRLERFSEQAAFFHSSLDGCDQAGKQAAEMIRKGSAGSGAEMIRK